MLRLQNKSSVLAAVKLFIEICFVYLGGGKNLRLDWLLNKRMLLLQNKASWLAG
jgi:hypothetical protein